MIDVVFVLIVLTFDTQGGFPWLMNEPKNIFATRQHCMRERALWLEPGIASKRVDYAECIPVENPKMERPK